MGSMAQSGSGSCVGTALATGSDLALGSELESDFRGDQPMTVEAKVGATVSRVWTAVQYRFGVEEDDEDLGQVWIASWFWVRDEVRGPVVNRSVVRIMEGINRLGAESESRVSEEILR